MNTKNTINRVLLRFLEAGEYETMYISRSFAHFLIKQVTLEITYHYSEADGFRDTDYFNGTGEYIETQPADLTFQEIQFYSKEGDKLDWEIDNNVKSELEAIIINKLEL